MTDRELRRLKRSELLEIMLEQQKEIDRLQKELEKTKALLADKRIMKRRAGTIAEAALQLNEVFEAAQRAADQYIYSVRKSYDRGLLTYDKEEKPEEKESVSEQVMEEADPGIEEFPQEDNVFRLDE